MDRSLALTRIAAIGVALAALVPVTVLLIFNDTFGHTYWHWITELKLNRETIPALTSHFSAPVLGIRSLSVWGWEVRWIVWGMAFLGPVAAGVMAVRGKNREEVVSNMALVLIPSLCLTAGFMVLLSFSLWLPFKMG